MNADTFFSRKQEQALMILSFFKGSFLIALVFQENDNVEAKCFLEPIPVRPKRIMEA